MAFVKKTWKDRISEYPNRRTINDGNFTKVVTVGRDEGNITQAGDAFNAANMNDMENRIEAACDDVYTKEETNEVIDDALKDVYPLGEASGDIASFNTGVVLPLKSCVCEINPIQASGTPTPDNPLPITGFSQADIGVSGKNLLNSSTLRAGDYDGSNPTIRVSQNLSDRIKCVAGTTYTFSFITGDDYGVAIVVTDKNNVIIETINLRTYNNITFTPTMSGYLTIVFLKGTGAPWSPITPADCQNLNPMVEIGDRETTYTPYTGNLYTVSFGQTIYGGKLIYDGQWSIEATHGYKDLGTLTWLQDSAYGSYFYTTGFSDKASGLTNMICSEYGNSTEYGNQQPDLTIRGAESGNVHRLFIRNNAIADATAFNTAIQGAMLCYELETPVIIPITSDTKVKTILGENNIYHDCNGDIDVIYHKALTAKNIYFDNSGTTLTATNVEDAIKEVLSRI